MATAQKETIVIIGDWFIDENWLVTKHNTYSSSHTGDIHFLSKHKKIGKRMISLCGASEILEVLRSYFDSPNFTDDEFPNKGSIDELCKFINQQIPDIGLSSTICTIEWLNEILMMPDLYKKDPIAKNLSEEIKNLIDKYEVDKTEDNLKKLNRCLLEKAFPMLTPKAINKEKYSFIGFGVWNKKDDKILQCILCPNYPDDKHVTPYTLHSLIEAKIDNRIRFCPYSQGRCTYEWTKLVNLSKTEDMSTNRIIRIYEGYGGGQPHLRSRIDWQLPIEDPTKKLEYSKFREELADSIESIKAIIIEDHGKGAVDENSIRELLNVLGEQSKQIRWYIRSKIDKPLWMNELKKKIEKARLRVVDYKFAQRHKGQRRTWFGNEVGRSSLELLGELTALHIYEHCNEKTPDPGSLNCERAAVLFDDNTAIAIDTIGKEKRVYNLYEPPGPKQLINIGRTTTFFNALIAQDLSDELNNIDFGNQCRKALVCAYEWSRQSSKAWNEEELYFYGKYSKALTHLNKVPNDNVEIKYSDYQESWRKWNSSSQLLGIIDDIDESFFQIWRGEGVIEGHICVGGPKRDRINKMLSCIAEFNEQNIPEYPLNCLLVSSPGWGKSFLAKSIAKHFNMSYMEFSLSQMASTNDLIDCFDSICSHQNRSDKKLLIFMDEVNCKIEGNLAMGLLLSPIWDGSFIRNGKYYIIDPAVWIFASTDSIDVLMSGGKNKGSDFVSRLNGPIIKLDSLEGYGNEDFFDLPRAFDELKKKLATCPKIEDIYKDTHYKKIKALLPPHIKTEQVYLGVSLLNRIWGPISEIRKSVLQLFHDMLPINGIRSMEFFVSKFQYIQRGIVSSSNVPLFNKFQELERHIILPENWDSIKSDVKYQKRIQIEALLTES